METQDPNVSVEPIPTNLEHLIEQTAAFRLDEPEARTEAGLRDQLRRAKAELRRMQRLQSLIFQALKNPNATAQQKQTCIAAGLYIISEISHLPPEEREQEMYVHVPMHRIAEASNCSPKRASQHIQEVLVESGLAEKRVERTRKPDVGEDGEVTGYRTNAEAWISLKVDTRNPTQAVERFVEQLARVDPPNSKRKNWGGSRVQCHNCGSENRRTVVYCADCSAVLHDSAPRSPRVEAPEGVGALPEVPASPLLPASADVTAVEEAIFDADPPRLLDQQPLWVFSLNEASAGQG